jgi:hypothetical protein
MPEDPPVLQEQITCPYDGQPAIKYGKYEGVQRYFCNHCKRKFTLKDAFFYMQHDRHNFFGRHESLGGKSPADLAGISQGISNWADLLEQAVPDEKYGAVQAPGCLIRLNPEEWNRESA